MHVELLVLGAADFSHDVDKLRMNLLAGMCTAGSPDQSPSSGHYI